MAHQYRGQGNQVKLIQGFRCWLFGHWFNKISFPCIQHVVPVLAQNEQTSLFLQYFLWVWYELNFYIVTYCLHKIVVRSLLELTQWLTLMCFTLRAYSSCVCLLLRPFSSTTLCKVDAQLNCIRLLHPVDAEGKKTHSNISRLSHTHTHSHTFAVHPAHRIWTQNWTLHWSYMYCAACVLLHYINLFCWMDIIYFIHNLLRVRRVAWTTNSFHR